MTVGLEQIAYSAIRELSTCKYLWGAHVRGAVVTAILQKGMKKDDPVFESVVEEVSTIVNKALIDIGYKGK